MGALDFIEFVYRQMIYTDDLSVILPETKHLVDTRLEAHDNEPEKGSVLNEIKARIKNQF